MDEILTEKISRSIWWGWGDPNYNRTINPQLLDYLRQRLGMKKIPPKKAAPQIEEVSLEKTRLTQDAQQALKDAIGEQNMSCQNKDRIIHAAGKSYKDQYRLFNAIGNHAPDAVLYPQNETDIQKIFEICTKYQLAIVPFGGGTSVVEGLEALKGKHKAVISLDMSAFNRMRKLDKISQLATLEAGMRGPEVERALQKHGYTMGHYPQSHQEATVGGYAVTRSSGQSSSGYGRFDQIVHGLRMVTPTGIIDINTQSPSSAAGPKLQELLVGSEGIYGIVTQVTVQIVPLPTHKLYGAYAFPNWETATRAFRGISQELKSGVMPTVCRLSDGPETADALRMAGKSGQRLEKIFKTLGWKEPCLAIFMWAGNYPSIMRIKKRAAHKLMRANSGVPLPSQIAKKWEKGRFSGPYMRDTLMSHSIMADTLETAANWANLQQTYQAVGKAIQSVASKHGLETIVHCHISHLYQTGASLYYTFVMPQSPDPIALWEEVKNATLIAINNSGVTVTHHHGVGAIHAPWVDQDHGGELGTKILNNIKQTLDPNHILNPQKTISSNA